MKIRGKWIAISSIPQEYCSDTGPRLTVGYSAFAQRDLREFTRFPSMGPWPGIEPGPAGPQPTVLTPTLPQPSSIAATEVFCLKVARLRYVLYMEPRV